MFYNLTKKKRLDCLFYATLIIIKYASNKINDSIAKTTTTGTLVSSISVFAGALVTTFSVTPVFFAGAFLAGSFFTLVVLPAVFLTGAFLVVVFFAVEFFLVVLFVAIISLPLYYISQIV